MATYKYIIFYTYETGVTERVEHTASTEITTSKRITGQVDLVVVAEDIKSRFKYFYLPAVTNYKLVKVGI